MKVDHDDQEGEDDKFLDVDGHDMPGLDGQYDVVQVYEDSHDLPCQVAGRCADDLDEVLARASFDA